MAAALVTWHFDRQPGPIELTEFLHVHVYIFSRDRSEREIKRDTGPLAIIQSTKWLPRIYIEHPTEPAKSLPLCQHASSVPVDKFLLQI